MVDRSLQTYNFDIRCVSEFILQIQNRMPNTEGDIVHKNYNTMEKIKKK